jgi:hypothetical protein
VKRLLGRSCSVVALVGAAGAVEWSRTSCLPMEKFMLDMGGCGGCVCGGGGVARSDAA